ncbi:MAG: FeS assembly SUF system protein [Bacteroidetes bacterium]|nr:MAG: FeS assembly SUF system protein [Bacteroidota bacterium]
MDKKKILEDAVTNVIKTIYDPEIPVNIYELGLIYDIRALDNGNVEVDMTLTTPNCPVAESLPQEVKNKIQLIAGVGEVEVIMVWEPTWDKDMMSEEAKFELGFL